jgi:hypothetical protein
MGRVGDDVEAQLELRTTNDICWRPGVVTSVRERNSGPPILHIQWSESENSKKVQMMIYYVCLDTIWSSSCFEAHDVLP